MRWLPLTRLPQSEKYSDLLSQDVGSFVRTHIACPVMRRTSSPLLLSFTISATVSIKFSRFGIWYLFSNMAILSNLAFNTVLKLWSFLTVMTTGWINIPFVILSTRLICPAASKLFISAFTAVCSCSGTLLPFSCVTFAPSLNSIFVVCSLILHKMTSYPTISTLLVFCLACH